MKKTKLLTLIAGSVFCFNASAYLSCADQGYDQHTSYVNTTSDWVSVIGGQSTGTYTDGTLTGIDAVAYQYGLQTWNQSYKNNWCSNKEAAMTSTIPPYGVPTPVAGTFSCAWDNEPTSSSDVTSVIKLSYCKTKGIRFR